MAPVVRPISHDYNVHIIRTEVVVPVLPIQEHVSPLTNLDLTIPLVSVHVFFCYKNTSNRNFASALSHLKTSLSRALVGYFIYAGKLVANSFGILEILYNSKGVQFTQGYAPTRHVQLNMYNPDETVQGKLVPLLANHSQGYGSPVFSVQDIVIEKSQVICEHCRKVGYETNSYCQEGNLTHEVKETNSEWVPISQLDDEYEENLPAEEEEAGIDSWITTCTVDYGRDFGFEPIWRMWKLRELKKG
ncbi:hypothetical protein KI387_033792 [Taxus chinensis]|uniref:Uncharacterized protein n=1 Tax=Taxus chinensis TaxID=29808 RepID=A0AA38F5L2_TAXCH|nr:hypothetical protein KI387_033792 [Taxus chinensis]